MISGSLQPSHHRDPTLAARAWGTRANFPTILQKGSAWDMPSDTIEDVEDIKNIVLNGTTNVIGAGCRLPTSQPALDHLDQELISAAEVGDRLYLDDEGDNNGFPGTPMLSYPLAGAIDVPTTVTLIWAQSDETDKYNIYVGLTDPPTVLAGTTTATSFQATALSPGTVYYWQVWAANGCSQTSSVVRVFTTGS